MRGLWFWGYPTFGAMGEAFLLLLIHLLFLATFPREVTFENEKEAGRNTVNLKLAQNVGRALWFLEHRHIYNP